MFLLHRQLQFMVTSQFFHINQISYLHTFYSQISSNHPKINFNSFTKSHEFEFKKDDVNICLIIIGKSATSMQMNALPAGKPSFSLKTIEKSQIYKYHKLIIIIICWNFVLVKTLLLSLTTPTSNEYCVGLNLWLFCC